MAASASVERFLTRLLIRVVRRRRLLWLVCCAAVAGAVALAVFAGNYGNDLGELFPPDSESGRTFRVMQKSGLTNRVQLEFDTGDAGIEQAKLAPWLDRLAPRLAALPQVRQVDYRFRTAPLADSMRDSHIRRIPACCQYGHGQTVPFGRRIGAESCEWVRIILIFYIRICTV